MGYRLGVRSYEVCGLGVVGWGFGLGLGLWTRSYGLRVMRVVGYEL